MSTQFHVGDTVRLEASFRNELDEAVNPINVELKVKPPRGPVAEYNFILGEVVHVQLGEFYYDLPILFHGVYTYKWTATGPINVAEERRFIVKKSEI